tara:strand:+ start:146 stop:670 length:525 start_codon:yes stop_codon:yes gene_type:complete
MMQKIFESKLIQNNHSLFVDKCNKTYERITYLINNKDTTWNYNLYNVFTVTAGDVYFHKLFKELVNIIKNYHKKDEPLWVQCWLNYHSDKQVLDWHDHKWLFHGYISIDPKDTKTIFENGFEVKNKPGNIYIGPCNVKHKVVVEKPYSGYRITLGFDVINEPNYQINTTSFVPI